MIASINVNYGGVGGKKLHDTVSTDYCVGDGEAFLLYLLPDRKMRLVSFIKIGISQYYTLHIKMGDKINMV